MKNAIIVVLLVLVLVLARAVVRLENFHYASAVGMCELPAGAEGSPSAEFQRHKCLHDTETRTHPVWHLYYALTDDF